jgi:hypothetical protein
MLELMAYLHHEPVDREIRAGFEIFKLPSKRACLSANNSFASMGH